MCVDTRNSNLKIWKSLYLKKFKKIACPCSPWLHGHTIFFKKILSFEYLWENASKKMIKNSCDTVPLRGREKNEKTNFLWEWEAAKKSLNQK